MIICMRARLFAAARERTRRARGDVIKGGYGSGFYHVSAQTDIERRAAVASLSLHMLIISVSVRSSMHMRLHNQ